MRIEAIMFLGGLALVACNKPSEDNTSGTTRTTGASMDASVAPSKTVAPAGGYGDTSGARPIDTSHGTMAHDGGGVQGTGTGTSTGTGAGTNHPRGTTTGTGDTTRAPGAKGDAGSRMEVPQGGVPTR